MKLFFLILILITLSCMVEFYDNLNIPEKSIFLKILENQSDAFYHVYFENIDSTNKSKGENINNKNYLNTKLFPGTYNIYIYSIVPKNDLNYYVNKYQIIKDVKIVEKKYMETKLETLSPEFELEYNNNQYILKIYIYKINKIFYISSISVKQGDDRVRSITYTFNKEEMTVYAIIPFYREGNWFLNLSLSLKSKIDYNILEKDSIYISTTYLKDIFLGNIIVN